MIKITGQEDVGTPVYSLEAFFTDQPEVIMQVLPHAGMWAVKSKPPAKGPATFRRLDWHRPSM